MEWKAYMEAKYSLPEIRFKEGEYEMSPKRRSTFHNNECLMIKVLETQKEDKQCIYSPSKPSKIDNFHLQGEFEGQLQPDIELYQHFVFMPSQLWKSLKKQYGGGPEFKRVYPYIEQILIT